MAVQKHSADLDRRQQNKRPGPDSDGRRCPKKNHRFFQKGL